MAVINPASGTKKMNKNILVVLGGAILAAVLVAVLVQVSMGGKKEPAPVVNGVEVLVAAKDLKKGSELVAGDIEWKKWPENTLFKGAIIRTDNMEADKALEGRLERSFSQGEALVRKAIIKESNANYVAARLALGERAVAIKVSAAAMVAGFITPGSYVDVILTYNQRVKIEDDSPVVKNMVQKNISKLATETILQNVRVLAIDQKAEIDEEDKDSIKVGKTVTLAVPIRAAEKLALASEMGEITLAMRGVGDDVENQTAPAISDARMGTIDDEIFAEYERLRKDAGINSSIVKIYNGDELQTVPVQ